MSRVGFMLGISPDTNVYNSWASLWSSMSLWWWRWPPMATLDHPKKPADSDELHSIMVPCHLGIHLLQGPRTSLIAWHWRFQPFLHLGKAGVKNTSLKSPWAGSLKKNDVSLYIPGFFLGGVVLFQNQPFGQPLGTIELTCKFRNTPKALSIHRPPFFSDPFCWVKRDRESFLDASYCDHSGHPPGETARNPNEGAAKCWKWYFYCICF